MCYGYQTWCLGLEVREQMRREWFWCAYLVADVTKQIDRLTQIKKSILKEKKHREEKRKKVATNLSC